MAHSDSEERLLTAADVAALLQVAEASVYNHWKQWGLPGIRWGGSLRFRSDGIQEWLDQRTFGDGR